LYSRVPHQLITSMHHAQPLPVRPPSLSLHSLTQWRATPLSTLSLHDALPISILPLDLIDFDQPEIRLVDQCRGLKRVANEAYLRSEEHTSELQSPCKLVCRLLLEKKKKCCS